MLINPLRTFDHANFGSIVDRDDPQVIPDYYAANIENWLIRNQGELQMRAGLTSRGTSPSATNLGSFVAHRADGSVYFYRVLNGAANSSKFQVSTNGTTWTDITSGGSRTTNKVWQFAQANNYVYAVNGYDTPIRLDGDVITTVAGIPNGTAILWWRNFLWVFAVISVPDRLYFSNANTPETFSGSDFVNVNLGDTSPGVGLRGTGGATPRLFIGKQRSVWYLTGSSSATFAIQPLTYEHGVASHESMVERKNDVWCVDLDGNIHSMYRSTEDSPFSGLRSGDIQNTISGLNKSAIEKSTAAHFDNFTLFFVPNGVDDYNSLVLVWDDLANKKRGGWVKFTNWNIARATVFDTTQPKLFLHDARTGNGQTYEWTGTTDNGISITAKYETKIYDHGFPEQLKKWRFAYQFGPALGNVNMRFYVSIDRYYYVLLKTVPLQGTGNKLLGVDWTLGVDKLGAGGVVMEKINYTDGGGITNGYTQQVKLEAESSSTSVRIRRFTSHFRYKGLR